MFSRDDLASDPFRQFEQWLNDALAEKRIEQPYAMTLATATSVGTPSARMVLLRGFDERGFVFYTNYDSQKARNWRKTRRRPWCFTGRLWTGKFELPVRWNGYRPASRIIISLVAPEVVN
jgi:pyridoxamine 5'-phosphate oxidase